MGNTKEDAVLIVGINGSPHREGTTKKLMRYVLDEVETLGAKTEMLEAHSIMADQKVAFCTHCSKPCSKVCFQGTRLDDAYELLRKADGVLLGSPVYFGCASAQIRAFFDKSRSLRWDRALCNVVAGAVAVGGARFGGQETTMRDLHEMALIQGMTVVGDGHFDDTCGHYGVGAIGGDIEEETRITRSKVLAQRMVEMCRATKELRCRT
jgi:multimeric flavodoxin WrbA